MATGQLGMILRHVHKLAGIPAAETLSDADLLDRFVTNEEEAAFAALVRRHGPMVLGVCQRVLQDSYEAEDAFQATFLVLLRKASDLKHTGSIAGWLYTVAYHAALKAKTGAARRNRQQRGMTDMPAEPDTEMLWRDVQPVLDEELSRLPEKYRDVVAQCYLEGKTCAEAGELLGCRASTVKSRLARARQLLRKRLSQRGVTLSSAALTAVLAEYATAAVSVRLLESTVQTALLSLSGAAAGSVGALAEGVFQTMFTTKIKVATACIALVCILALGAGVLTHSAAAQNQAQVGRVFQPVDKNVGRVFQPVDFNERRVGKPILQKKKDITVTGRVLNAKGKPIAKAHIAVVGSPKRHDRPVRINLVLLTNKVLAHTKVNAAGQFRLLVPRTVLEEYGRLYAVAGGPGFGISYKRIDLGAKNAETVVNLPREMIIRGKLRNLQGQPAPGVEIKIWQGTRGNKTETVRLSALPKKQFPYWPGPVTSDKDGKFVVHGVNPLYAGTIQFHSDKFAMEWQSIEGGKDKRVQVINRVLAPAQIIEGVVTAADTGKPVPNANVLVHSSNNVNAPRAMGAGATGKTDAQGYFRINPPVGKLYTIRATPPAEQPYLRVQKTFKWPAAAIQQTVNINVPRGVMVRGMVAEADSGKPVANAVVRDADGIWTNPYVESKSDGSFEIVVKPGKSHLIVKGPNNEFIPYEATYNEIRGGTRSGTRFYPDAVVPLNLKKGTKTHDVSVKIKRGVTIRGTLIGPDGKRPKSATMLCWNQVRQKGSSWFGAGVFVANGKFELRGCEPKKSYTVYFLDAVNRLGATVKLSAKKAKGKSVTVKLVPCGKATARFVDKQGSPLVGYQPIFYFIARKGKKPFRDDDDFVANIDPVNYSARPTTDAEGRYTFSALIPGATYRVKNYRLQSARDIVVAPGEDLLMPDITITRP